MSSPDMAVENISAFPEEDEDVESMDMINASIIIVIAVIVNITNFLTLLVVRSYKYVFNPNILIGGIALVNYGSTLSLCPLIAYTYLAEKPLPTFICGLFDAFWTFYQLMSTSIFTLMVLDRYLAIRKPILYRTRLSGALIKYIMVCVLLTSIPLSFTPFVKVLAENTVVELESEGSRTKQCIGLHYQYYQVHRILVLSINCVLLLLGMFCYINFLLGVRNFVNRWLVRFSNQNSSPVEPPVAEASSCWCRCAKEQPQKSLSKEQLVERTLHLMKSLHVKRCTRISKTIAVSAGIYYIPWLISQGSVFYELLTGSYLPLLDYVIIRIILASSILNPIVYVTFSKTYRYGYQRVLVKPLRLCGYEWRSRKPLGLTGSEMQRISHRMALEEWESPGLVRRQYSKRRIKRKIARMHHVYTVSENNGNGSIERKRDQESTGRQSRYRKNSSMDASIGAGMTSASVKIARCRRNTGHGNGVHAMNPLPNGDPPFVQQMDFPASSQGLSNDENVSTVFSENLPRALDSFPQTVRRDSKSASEVYSQECTGKDEIRLQSKDSLPEPNKYLPQTLQTLAASAVQLAKRQTQGQITVYEASLPERARGECVSMLGSNGTTVLKPFEISAETNAQGHVCIHLEVIEFVNRNEMKHKNGSLVSTIRKCQLLDKSQRTTKDEQHGPSFVFSLRENRFLPERIHQESVDTYSYQNGEDTASHSILNTGLPNGTFAPMQNSADISEANQESSHFLRTTKERQKRTSEILRESSRYIDDIAKLNDLILQDHNHDNGKMHKRTPVDSSVSSKAGSLNNHEAANP